MLPLSVVSVACNKALHRYIRDWCQIPGELMTASLSAASPNHQRPERFGLVHGGIQAHGLRSLPMAAQSEGQLQIHTAPFRGSFGSVLSQALRTAGLGSRVLVSQLLKGGVDQGVASSVWLCGRLQWLRPAVPACLADFADREACAAVQEVWAFSREQLTSGAVDLMVLDELGLAMELGYLEQADVLDALERRPAQVDVILTGPAMGPALMALADQVTELRRGF